jgi:hypothetical protein
MPRVTMQELKDRCDALTRINGALQEYVTVSNRSNHTPDARKNVHISNDDDEHVFELFGARRASGGVLLHTHFVDGVAVLHEVVYFEDALSAWRVNTIPDMWPIRDAMDWLDRVRRKILEQAA